MLWIKKNKLKMNYKPSRYISGGVRECVHVLFFFCIKSSSWAYEVTVCGLGQNNLDYRKTFSDFILWPEKIDFEVVRCTLSESQKVKENPLILNIQWLNSKMFFDSPNCLALSYKPLPHMFVWNHCIRWKSIHVRFSLTPPLLSQFGL